MKTATELYFYNVRLSKNFRRISKHDGRIILFLIIVQTYQVKQAVRALLILYSKNFLCYRQYEINIQQVNVPFSRV